MMHEGLYACEFREYSCGVSCDAFLAVKRKANADHDENFADFPPHNPDEIVKKHNQ